MYSKLGSRGLTEPEAQARGNFSLGSLGSDLEFRAYYKSLFITTSIMRVLYVLEFNFYYTLSLFFNFLEDFVFLFI